MSTTKANTTPATLTEIIERFVKESGPVSYNSIANCVFDQFHRFPEEFEIKNALTSLIRIGSVSLYDDGQSFI